MISSVLFRFQNELDSIEVKYIHQSIDDGCTLTNKNIFKSKRQSKPLEPNDITMMDETFVIEDTAKNQKIIY